LKEAAADSFFGPLALEQGGREAGDLALATSHLAQSSSASRVIAAQAGFFILSQSGERPER
jgi:hypothetical protein